MADLTNADEILEMSLEGGDKIYRHFKLAKDFKIDRLDVTGTIREIRKVFPNWIVMHTHKDKPVQRIGRQGCHLFKLLPCLQ